MTKRLASRVSTALAQRQPKFRLIAATTMVFLIGCAIITAAMAAMLGLDKLVDDPAESTGSFGLITYLDMSLDSYAFGVLVSISVATLLLALLLRKVVLSGLRER